MASNRNILKAYFNTGDRPTEVEFADLIDSTVNVNDKATDIEIDAGTNDDKYVTVSGSRRSARKSIKVNNVAPDVTTGNIVVNNIPALINLTTAGVVKTSAVGALSSGAVNLANSEVSGILPLTNGGTGSSTQSFVDLTTAQTIIGKKTFKEVTLSPGTASVAPLSFTPTNSVLKTTNAAGEMETDSNGILYYTHNPLSRGVVLTEQSLMRNTASNGVIVSLANVLNPLFAGVGPSTNGAIILKALTCYFFECQFDLSGISNVNGTFSFGLTGTAISSDFSIKYEAFAVKSNLGEPSAALMTIGASASHTPLVVANVAQTGHARITGIIRTINAGTLIPSFALSAVVPNPGVFIGQNSYFRLIPVGLNNVTAIGKFS